MFKPSDVIIDDDPIIPAFVNTLGRAELEFCAGLIVRWHQVKGHVEWTSMCWGDIVEFVRENPNDPYIMRSVKNPFWRPDPFAFSREGYISGWDKPDVKGELTPKFFEAVEKEHNRRRERGMYLGMRKPAEAT